MHTFGQELRYALRQLRQAPGFALISILTLALGIGANIAVFSVTNAVLLNPSGIPHAQGLVALRARYMALADLHNIGISAPDFGDAEDGHNIFSSAAVMQANSVNYSPANATPIRLRSAKVSHAFFDVFGVRPLLGRVLLATTISPALTRKRCSPIAPGKNNLAAIPRSSAAASCSTTCSTGSSASWAATSTGPTRSNSGLRSRCRPRVITITTFATTRTCSAWRGCNRA